MSAPSPSISVILPTYNGARHVRESIESVLAQDLGDFRLVVCDDGSTDDTWTIVNKYAGPRCTILKNSANRGLFPTLNRLMGEVQTDWVHLWSQDDRMLPDCLRRTVEFARTYPDVGMIYSRMHFIDENGRRLPERKLDDPTPPVVEPLLAAQIMFYFGSIAGNIANVTIRKSAFDALGNFREDLKVSGDLEYWTRLSKHYNIGHQKENLIELRDHADQFSRRPGSAALFIRENREIHDQLFARLPETERRSALRFRRSVIQVNNFHFAMKSLARGQWSTSLEVLRMLRTETALLPLAFRWVVSANGHRVARPELVPQRESA